MKIRWTHLAINDFHHACDFIAIENPKAARSIALKTQESLLKISLYPQIGRKGRVIGTREFVIPQTPFIVIYSTHELTIDILAFLHGARQWPSPSS